MNLLREDNQKETFFSKKLNINNFIFFLMFCVYPLLVIPNNLGYFYFPRYIMLGFMAILSFIFIIEEKKLSS